MQQKLKIFRSAHLWSMILAIVPSYAFADISQEFGPASDPLALYGDEIYFDVYRSGEKVGFHQVSFEKSGADLTVRSRFEVEVDVLFFTAFRYLYQSEGKWQGGRLKSLKAEVNDDGETFSVQAQRIGDKTRVETPEGSYLTKASIFPTNHWNPAVLPENQVLNTLTGRINNVKIEPQARETVDTMQGKVPATRFAYSGDLDTEVWYDDGGRWVKMRFKGRDGSMIEYVCRRCQGDAEGKLAQ